MKIEIQLLTRTRTGALLKKIIPKLTMQLITKDHDIVQR